jgi:hypothetical protein
MNDLSKLNSINSDLLLFTALTLASGFLAITLGQDANWDLLNYHYYNPYALLNGRVGQFDLAPAQLQTYLNPLFDLPSYFALKTIENPRVATFLIGSMAGPALFFLYKISCLVLISESDLKSFKSYALIVVLVGLNGSVALSTLGTTFTEWISAGLILCSLYCFLIFLKDNTKNSYLIVASFVVGIAIGGKLTNTIFFIGFILALFISDAKKSKKIILILFGFSFTGILLSLGYWSLFLYSNFDSPIFPFYNQFFLSTWFEPLAIGESGARYLPKSLSQWFFYPYYWGLIENNTVAEVSFRDPRLFTAYSLIIIYAIYNLLNYFNYKLIEKISKSTFFILIFFLFSYLAWLIKFSIYRYLLPLELISPMITLVLLSKIFKGKNISLVLILITIVLTYYLTKPMQWGRVDFGESFFSSKTLPEISNDSLLVFYGDDPMSYVLPLLNKSVMSVGIENNFIKFEQDNKLLNAIKDRIENHGGAKYSVSSVKRESEIDIKLSKYKQYRIHNSCKIYQSNIGDPLIFCRLTKNFNESINSKPEDIELLKNIKLNSPTHWSSFTPNELNAGYFYVTVNEKKPVTQITMVEPTSKYVNSVSIRCHRENAQGRLQVNWLDDKKQFISSSGSIFDCKQDWQRYSEIVIAPLKAKYAEIYLSGHTEKFVEVYNPSFKK